jgi:hypothetical protein
MNESRANVRDSLLEAALWFVRAAAQLSGVRRIAFVGSILSHRQHPKDIDLLVYVADDADLVPLASTARRSKGGSRARIAVPTYSWRTNNTGIWGGPVPGSCASPGFVPHVMRSTAAGGRISMTTWRQFDSLIRSSRRRPLTSGPPSCADAKYLPMSRRW